MGTSLITENSIKTGTTATTVPQETTSTITVAAILGANLGARNPVSISFRLAGIPSCCSAQISPGQHDMTHRAFSPDSTQADVTNDASTIPLELLNAEQLGRLLHLGSASPGSARAALNLRISRGHALPPYVQIPGSKERYWRLETVLAWLAEREVPINPVRRRRGRPSKVESVLEAGIKNDDAKSKRASATAHR